MTSSNQSTGPILTEFNRLEARIDDCFCRKCGGAPPNSYQYHNRLDNRGYIVIAGIDEGTCIIINYSIDVDAIVGSVVLPSWTMAENVLDMFGVIAYW